MPNSSNSRMRKEQPWLVGACNSCWRKPTDERHPCSQLNSDGICQDCAECLSDGRPISRMTYARHRCLNREFERRAFAMMAKIRREAARKSRREFLQNELDSGATWISTEPTVGCFNCGMVPDKPHYWPQVQECILCGTKTILDKHLLDEDEVEEIRAQFLPDKAKVVLAEKRNVLTLTSADCEFLVSVGVSADDPVQDAQAVGEKIKPRAGDRR